MNKLDDIAFLFTSQGIFIVGLTCNGRESEWTPGVGDGQGGLACCDSWGRKELDTTEQLNWTELNLQYSMVDRCSAMLRSSIHGKRAHVHGMSNHSSFLPGAPERSQNPSQHGIWGCNYGPIKIRTQNVTWDIWMYGFSKDKEWYKDFSVILLLPHQAYLVPWPGLLIHLITDYTPVGCLPSICVCLVRMNVLFRTQLLCITFSEIIIPHPFFFPFLHPQAELTSFLRCLPSTMEDSRSLCHLSPFLSSPIAVSSRADMVQYVDKCTHIHVYTHTNTYLYAYMDRCFCFYGINHHSFVCFPNY